MEDKNVLDLLLEIQEVANKSEIDAEKVIKGNNTAGIRLRKVMQKIKNIAQEVRDEIQKDKKNRGVI